MTPAPVKWRIKELMDRHRVPGRLLAQEVGVSESTVTSWRQTDVLPELGGVRLGAIAAALSRIIEKDISGKDLIQDEK
jgi:DNA-binding Xre family transcriptional regulator